MKILFATFQKKRIKGFTLVETLSAVFVISMVILGPLTVAIRASSYARETKDVMIATYLAQEALELLHHQQDSIYIRCVSAANAYCTLTDPEGDGIYELPREAAWRIFRTRLTTNPNCFTSPGCSYDFIDFTTNQNTTPTKYLPTSASCSELALTSQNLYVCAGIPSHVIGSSVATTFTRAVQIVSINTFTETGTKYNDDFRVTATVTFRRANGYQKQIKVIDFLHARS